MRVRIDPEDGGPAWDPTPGSPLVPGLLAWRRLAVGHRRETWLCWSVPHWEGVLVKVVRPGWTPPTYTRALDREVAALRGVNHPAFPRLLADGTGDPLPHLVTDYFNGPALDEVLCDGPLPATDVANLGVDLLAAVRYLHAAGLAHLDICPDNVATVQNRARLVDLGAARRLGCSLPAGEQFGTDGFLAPELAGWPGGPVTAALDLFSVGASLREALDPSTDPTGAVTAVVDRLTDADPGRRPSADAALAALVRSAGARRLRPWPRWADRHLGASSRRPGRDPAEGRAAAPDDDGRSPTAVTSG